MCAQQKVRIGFPLFETNSGKTDALLLYRGAEQKKSKN